MTARRLVIAFVGLVMLAGASWLLSSAGAPAFVSLGIAAAKAVWIGLVFMELASADTVARTSVVIAVLFVVLLCAGTLTDVALRQ